MWVISWYKYGCAFVSPGGPGLSCAWPEPEGDESPGLAGQPVILSRVDGSGLGHRARFCQPLDEEPGREDFLAGPLQRRQPVSHRPARAPGLLDSPDVEVATPVTQPVPGRVQPGQHQRAIGPQD